MNEIFGTSVLNSSKASYDSGGGTNYQILQMTMHT